MTMAGVPAQRSVPLVRIEGLRPYDTGEAVTPERLAADPRLLRRFKTKRTCQAELALELGDCLYFYVGYACPHFGDMVFVFDPVLSAAWPGTATPFDTGGIIGHIRAEPLNGTTVTEEQRRNPSSMEDDVKTTFMGYVHAHRILDLGTWRGAFEAFISSHFDSAADYVQGQKPKVDDPTGRHRHPDNERRAWTWEIQKHQDHDIFDGLWLLCLNPDRHNELRKAVRDLADHALKTRWQALLRDKNVVPDLVDEHPAYEAERRMAQWLQTT